MYVLALRLAVSLTMVSEICLTANLKANTYILLSFKYDKSNKIFKSNNGFGNMP